MTISSAPAQISGFTSEYGDLLDRLQFRKASGSTAFVDTLYLALSHMRAARNERRALLVISDGMDNHSRYSKGELKNMALEANVQIHTIALYDPPLNKKPMELQEERRGLLLLDEVARQTGGLHFVAANQTEIEECVAKIGRALRSEYVIGYQPRSLDRSGKWRQIQVKTTLPDVRVYARSGYYAE
jgi:Ca-activated chloride channel homolog